MSIRCSMRIKILGTRANIEKTAPYHSKHSGVLVDDEILLDLGEKEYLQHNPKHIFITHLHPDHAKFVKEEIEEIEGSVYAPETSNKIRGIRKICEPVRVDSYTVTPVPTHHSLKVDSMAYVLQRESRRILYTGDMIWINKEYHSKMKNLDLVITDGSFMRHKGLIRRDEETEQIYGHNGIPDLVDLFRDFTKHIVFTHFGSWFYKDIQQSKKKIESLGNAVKVEAAYDGMVIEL